MGSGFSDSKDTVAVQYTHQCLVTLVLPNGENEIEGRALVLGMQGIGLLLGNDILKKFSKI